MQKIPCVLFRGGTSKGPFFLKDDLPSAPALRDEILLKVMGAPDAREIDGIGGGDSLTSKVAIVSKSDRDDAELNYLFCQVHVEEPLVETALNCGNMLSGVVPFGIMKGLVKTQSPQTTVKVYNENTGVIILVTVQTPEGQITYEGKAKVDGVPGTGAAIKLSFLNPVGAKTGKLLPTGNVIDTIDGIDVTCLDVTLPMALVNAASLGKTGYESKKDLDADKALLKKLEHLRKKAALKMGLGDVSHLVSPKIAIVSPAKDNGMVHSCYFTPFACHSAHAVSGAFCVTAACFIEGSVANQVAALPEISYDQSEQVIELEHVSGKIEVMIVIDKSEQEINFPAVSCFRTARPLLEGHVFIRD